MKPPSPSEVTTGEGASSQPFMIDIMSGPKNPLSKAFEMSGWRILAVDMLFGEDHDLSKLSNQVTIREHFKHADFVWAALDCSDKARIREIPSKHAGSKSLPSPLRSEEFPMGLPDLQGYDKDRVTASNDAAEFILGELRLLQTRGGASGRENPANSRHWYTPTEMQMMAGSSWWGKFMHASRSEKEEAAHSPRRRGDQPLARHAVQAPASSTRMDTTEAGQRVDLVPKQRGS